MRSVLLTIAVLAVAFGSAAAEVERVSIGDVPRTNTHYLNAGEAALCRADAATGGVGASFYNPAVITRVLGASGLASVRYNVKSRNYLPDDLEASDDGFLFSQAVAVKSATPVTYGFSYAAPSYRNVEISRLVGEAYDASFTGGLRFFEVLLGTSVGSEHRGGIGVAAGIVDLTEESRVSRPGDLESERIDGLAASLAFGFVFEAAEWLTVGVGHRSGASVEVESELEAGGGKESGTSWTQSTSVIGVTYRPTGALAVYASYVNDGWDAAKSTLAAYPDPERDLFSDALGTAALGIEFALPGDRFVIRAGGSKVLVGEAEDAVVPEYSAGLGAVVRFRQYSGEVSLVREQFELDGESAEVVNYGIYASVGYEF